MNIKLIDKKLHMDGMHGKCW